MIIILGWANLVLCGVNVAFGVVYGYWWNWAVVPVSFGMALACFILGRG